MRLQTSRSFHSLAIAGFPCAFILLTVVASMQLTAQSIENRFEILEWQGSPIFPQSTMRSYYQTPSQGGWQYGINGNSGEPMIWDNQILQAELEMTRDQRRKLLEFKLDYDEQMGQAQLRMLKMQARVYRLVDGEYKVDPEAQKRWAELKKTVSELRSEMMEKADSVLMPHQRELKIRLAGSKVLEQSGFVGFLMNSSIQKQLGVDSETKKRLAEKAKELEARIQSEVGEFIRKAHDELIGELDGNSRRIAEELLDHYEYSEKGQGISLLYYDRYFLKKRATKEEEIDK